MDMTQLNDYTTRSEAVCRRNDTISPRLYEEYGVKKGLRDENGNGVLAGLTNISKITSSKIVDGKKVPCDGQLWYRGYRVEDLIGSLGETELGYEKIAYLLLMGQMPDSAAAMGSSPKASNTRPMIKLNSRIKTKISSVWRSAAKKMLLVSSCSSWQSTSSAWPS